jgi:hypothetical protein
MKNILMLLDRLENKVGKFLVETLYKLIYGWLYTCRSSIKHTNVNDSLNKVSTFTNIKRLLIDNIYVTIQKSIK